MKTITNIAPFIAWSVATLILTAAVFMMLPVLLLFEKIRKS